LGPWIEWRKPSFGRRIKVNFEHVSHLDRSVLKEVSLQREKYFHDLQNFLGSTDLLCFPTTTQVAPLKNSLQENRFEDEYYVHLLSVTSVAGIGRLPQVTLPIAQTGGVPVGLSVAGAFGEDKYLFEAIQALDLV